MLAPIRNQVYGQPNKTVEGARIPRAVSPAAQDHPVLQFQRSLGNREVQRLLTRVAEGPTVQRKTAGTADEKRVSACMAQKDDILPGGIGAVAGISREVELQETLGAELDPLIGAIRGNADARRFVCEAGVPAMLALWDMRAPAGTLDVPAARAALKADTAKVYSENLDTSWLRRRRIVHAQTKMLDVADLTAQEARSSHLPVLLLPSLVEPQMGNVKQAAHELDEVAPVFESSTKQFAGAAVSAEHVSDRLGEAVVEARRAQNPDYMGGPREPLEKAKAAAKRLRQELEIVHRGIDASELVTDSATFATELERLSPSAGIDALASARDAARALRKRVAAAAAQVTDLAGAARRVSFVLRYFAALNSPGFAGAPDKDEGKAMIGKVDNLGPDLELLFGPSAGLSLAFFKELGEKINRQLGVHRDMETGLGHETALVPPQADVLSYFLTFAKKNNAAVSQAYTDYAQAFFEHRVIVTFSDFNVKGLEEIFARPLSLSGSRPLVCTGYAILGANLFAAAGGRTKEFIVAVRASDAQLLSNSLDEGHAVAVVQRGGETLYVSNHLVVKNVNDAIGPNAVEWTHQQFTLIPARGPTLQAAIAALQTELARRTQGLSHP